MSTPRLLQWIVREHSDMRRLFTPLIITCALLKFSSQVTAADPYTIFNELPEQTANLSVDGGFHIESPSAKPEDPVLGEVYMSNAETTQSFGSNHFGSVSGAAYADYGDWAVVDIYPWMDGGGSYIYFEMMNYVSTGEDYWIPPTLDVTLTHSISASIADANSIVTTEGSTRFAHQFNVTTYSALEGVTVNQDIQLIVSAWVNGTEIASASVFDELLGLTIFDQWTYYSPASFEFDYDPSSGPLEIKFDSTFQANAETLDPLLASLTSTIYYVADQKFGYLTPVPEPSSLLLCAAGLGLLARRSRRSTT